MIVDGCSAMYDKNVMHRDLKLANILIHFPQYDDPSQEDMLEMDLETVDFCVKIADLGYARELTKAASGRTLSFKGSPLMMAPEQLGRYFDRGSGYNHKIDVWAMGVIFYQFLTGMFMFDADPRLQVQGKNALMLNLLNNVEAGTWSWPKDISISLGSFDFLNKTMHHLP